MLHGVAAVAASLLAGAGLLTAPAAVGALADRGGAPARSVAAAVERCGPEPSDAAGWEALFDAQSGAWAGGDGAARTRLPDGRLLWLYGDTYTGSVTAQGRRGDDLRLVRNSAVVTDGTCVHPVAAGTELLPGRAGTWLWPTNAVVQGVTGRGATVLVFAQRLSRDPHDGFGFRRTGTAVATLLVPDHGDPRLLGVRDLPVSTVLWGAGLLREGATTWVYGTRDPGRTLVLGRELLLARAPTVTLDDASTWTYRTARGWSPHEADAVPVRSADDGVSTVTAFARVDGRYVAVTKAHEFLDDDVVAVVSPTPWGPWQERPLFVAASTSSVLRYQPMLESASSVHGVTTLHVVVSRTTTDLGLLRRDAEITRPSFVDVVLPS